VRNKLKLYSILLIGLVVLLAGSVVGCGPMSIAPPETLEVAKAERASVQTALIVGMADNSVGSVTAGTVTPADSTKTVYYPETVYHPGGTFQLEDYMPLPTHGSWTWDSTGIVTDGTYSGGGETCVYNSDETPQWSCTAS